MQEKKRFSGVSELPINETVTPYKSFVKNIQDKKIPTTTISAVRRKSFSQKSKGRFQNLKSSVTPNYLSYVAQLGNLNFLTGKKFFPNWKPKIG